MKKYLFPIVLNKDSDGYFVTCPSLQGCYSQGDTYEEAVENIKDAIKLHIAARKKTKEPIADYESVSIASVEIKA